MCREAGMAWDPDRVRRAFNPPPEHYDVRGTVAFALTLANRALRQYVALDRFELGLHEGRDLVMVELARRAGRATSSELATSLGLTRGTVSTLVRRSEAAGLLRRDRSFFLAEAEAGLREAEGSR
jgi:CRP-like cAMP-binding protein